MTGAVNLPLIRLFQLSGIPAHLHRCPSLSGLQVELQSPAVASRRSSQQHAERRTGHCKSGETRDLNESPGESVTQDSVGPMTHGPSG